MSEQISVTIPVLPHIKKYLDKNTFLKCNYDLSLNDNIGIFIMRLLDTAPKYYKPIKPGTDFYIGHRGGRVRAEIININLRGYINTGKTHISSRSIHLFNSWVNDMIRREMYVYIESRLMERQREIKTIILDFIDKYNFCDDELTYWSLERWYFRNKKKLQALDQQ